MFDFRKSREALDCRVIPKRKRAFLSLIKKELEPFVQSAKEQNNFDWAHLRRLFNNRKNELTKLYYLRIFCDFAFDLFFKFNCDDYELMAKFVRMREQVMEQYARLDLCGHCIMSNRLPKHYLDEEILNTRTVLKQINTINLNTYSFANSDFYGVLTNDAILEGDYAYVQFSVKYGLCYISSEDIFIHFKAHLETLYGNYVALNPQVGTDTLERRENFADSVFRRLFGTSLLNEFDALQTSKLTRMGLIMMYVSLSVSKGVRGLYYSTNPDSYNLYAMTLSEPTISMKDMTDFLDIVFVNDEVFKNYVISLFKQTFPKTPSLPSPRSLKHLCRCKVRYCIKKVPSLPAVLSEIEIPTTVKDYLLYMCD